MTAPSDAGGDDACVVVEALAKSFRAGAGTVRALDGVDARIRRGVVTGLVGPDGAGKTTLMRLVAGLLAPDGGRVRVFGHDSTRESLAVQALAGYMPQRFGLYEDLTVAENLDLYADLHGVARAERPARYAELTRMTGLARFTERLAGKLSGGMKQKLGLACTLVHPPRLLLLDEPTVGVDPVSRRELWHIIHRLVEEAHTTVLLSTAYLDEAERCAEVVLMHAGRVLGQDTPDAFARRMQGRSYRISTEGTAKRRVQTAASHCPGVLDAAIEGEHVRVLAAGRAPPDLAALAGLAAPGAAPRVEPVAPRFEDAFVAILREHVAGTDASAEAAPAPRAPPRADDDVIAVHEVSRRFGDFWAVRGVSFRVRRGEVFGLLGANGAGKSTTFRMLCGLLPASGGSLRVAGEDLRRAPARARARIGYMAQRFSLYGHLSVDQNLRFFASAYGLHGARRRARIEWALTGFELAPFADAPARDLSLGHRQRLALAAALMHEPEILFLDEPTSGVDPIARREFWARINALAESGVTVLVTTHFMAEANYCDRLVVMADGEILAEGTPAALKAPLRTPALPEPDMEDAFVALVEARAREAAA